MATRSRMRSAMVMAALAPLIVAAIWTARSAEAIIIVNSRTGTFTLTSHDAVRIYVANTAEEAGIIIVNSIFDRDGNLLEQSGPQRVPLGRSGYFEYTPVIPDGARTAVRVEVTVDGSNKEQGFLPTVEVLDRASAQTRLFVDCIIDDGK